MIGYNMEYGAFTIVEVMSSEDFSQKRIGFLACAQCFHEKVEMVQMIPNLLRNALNSQNVWEQGLALSCLSNICTAELGEILVSEVANLLSNQRSYLRKKTLLTLFKIFLQYPAALRPAFPRIKEKLDDPDPSVTAAAVNVICELARRNPKNYLGMAPVFFKLFSNITNNWTLIKIVKVFGALAPEEPRLLKKLAEPLSHCINTTPAKSLLYEALQTVASNSKTDSALMALTVEKLKQMVEDPDQNLKYLGLKGMGSVMKSNPALLSSSKDIIIDCLGDEDVTIRLRALDLVGGLVSKRSIASVISRMIGQMEARDDDDYRNTIVKYIIEICSQQDYAFITNFEWYLRVLMDLTQSSINHFEYGELINREFMNVITRVKAVRAFGVKCVSSLICNPLIYQRSEDQKSTLNRVLASACYLSSEYVRDVPSKLSVVSSLMKRRVLSLPGDIQAVALQAVLKIYSYVCNPEAFKAGIANDSDDSDDEDSEHVADNDDCTAEQLHGEIFPDADDENKSGIKMFLSSCDVDVYEHSASILALLELHKELVDEGSDIPLCTVFSQELLPVAKGAQLQVPQIDLLDEVIMDYVPQLSDDDDTTTMESSYSDSSDEWAASFKKPKRMSKAQLREMEEKERVAAELARKNNPHYLPTSEPSAASPGNYSDDQPPIEELKIPSSQEDFNLGTRGFKEKKSKKSKKSHKMMTGGAAPEGYKKEKTSKQSKKEENDDDEHDSIWKQLDVDLSKPTRESLPTVKPYERMEASDFLSKEKKEKKRKKKGKKGEDSSEGESEKEKKSKKDKKKKRKKKDKLDSTEEEESEQPQDTPEEVAISVSVEDCQRKKKKGRPNFLLFNLKIVITNNSKGTLRSLSLKVKDGARASAGEGFQLTRGAINQTDSGHSIKIAKNETQHMNIILEVDEIGEVGATLSYTSKDVPVSIQVELLKGMHDAMTTGKKLTRDKFVEQMTQLQDDPDFKCDKLNVDVPQGCDLKDFLDILRDTIKVRTIEVLDNCAALAGMYISPDAKCPVFVLVKARNSSSASVEIKSTASQEIISALFAAISEAASGDAKRPSTSNLLLSDIPSDPVPEKKSKKDRSEKPKKEKRDKRSAREPEPKEEKKEKSRDKKPKKEAKTEAKPSKKATDDLSFLDM
eukprot:TRINITY_DN1336_c2_g1_i1.p1 TRINITY_DN1336_c2_g1~~TRINITY_DN1336_c2_g1_i1.p1  ORF type:complete len:1225 (+),score=312.23 TRINITY_DN1336_c2_g1_i1:246-3677(+)